MAPTLAGARFAGFSETARSGPRHGEAGRDGAPYRRAAAAVGARRDADDVAEGPAEGAQTGEADVEADVGHAAIGLAQQPHRALDAAALEVAVGRLAERRPEGADEVRLGDAGDPGERRHVERLGVGPVH